MGVRIQSLDVIANNIANSETQGFTASRVEFSETNVSQAGQHPNGVMNQYGGGVEVSGVVDTGSATDLSTEFATLLQTGVGIKANAAVVKGSDWMLQTLLSM
jgi:flagellar hook protein FlgE